MNDLEKIKADGAFKGLTESAQWQLKRAYSVLGGASSYDGSDRKARVKDAIERIREAIRFLEAA